MIGKTAAKRPIVNLALDRIITLDYDLTIPYLDEDFDGDVYYKNTFGVTVLNDEQCQEIMLKIDRGNAPYVLTKPFHSSQEMIERLPDGSVIFKLKVHLNFEVERLILGFGDSLEVLEPRQLRRRIKIKLKNALKLYS